MSRMGRRGAIAGPRAPANLTVTISGTFTATAATVSRTFSGITGAVTAGGVGPYTWSWGVTSADGGTWSISAGGTTSAPTIQAINPEPATTTNATLTATATETATGLVGTKTQTLSYTRT